MPCGRGKFFMRTEENFYAHENLTACPVNRLGGRRRGSWKGKSAFALAGKEAKTMDLATDRKGIAEARHGEDPQPDHQRVDHRTADFIRK